MSDEPTTEEQPEQTTPLRTVHRPPRPAEPDVEDRTSPFPYAEKFDEWVADETAPSDAQPRHRRPGIGNRARRR